MSKLYLSERWLQPGLHDDKMGRTRWMRQDRLKYPQDGSFETIPRIYDFLVINCQKNPTSKSRKEEIDPAQLNLLNCMAVPHMIYIKQRNHMAAATSTITQMAMRPWGVVDRHNWRHVESYTKHYVGVARGRPPHAPPSGAPRKALFSSGVCHAPRMAAQKKIFFLFVHFLCGGAAMRHCGHMVLHHARNNFTWGNAMRQMQRMVHHHASCWLVVCLSNVYPEASKPYSEPKNLAHNFYYYF